MQRFKVTATIQWDFDSDIPKISDELHKAALEQLGKILPCNICARILKIDELKERKKKVVLGTFKPEEILPHISGSVNKKEFKVGNEKYNIRMNSHRYFVFNSSLNCVSCDLEGVKFLLEKHPSDKTPHFNLYAEEDGELILMTKDHIRAKSYGGEDRHSNYQTMCSICNNLKGSANLTLEGIKFLRTVYNDNKRELTKKQLNGVLSEVRIALTEDRPHDWVSANNQNNINPCDVVLKCDVNIFRNSEVLIAKSVYDEISESDGEHIACAKKGSILFPVENKNGRFLVDFNDQRFAIYHGLTEFVSV